MKRNILNQAFIHMGYRQLTSSDKGNVYGKPLGFCLIVAEIQKNHKVIDFCTIINKFDNPAEKLKYGSSKMDIDYIDEKKGYEDIPDNELYENYCRGIAYAETESGVENAIYAGRKNKPFAFAGKYDVISTFIL